MAASKRTPPNIITRLDIPTESGILAVTTSLPTNPPPTSTRFDPATGQAISPPDILFIHGNSSSSQIFQDFFLPPASTTAPDPTKPAPSPPLCATHRLITFDLPGHGASPNADNGKVPPPVPYTSHYSMPVYALAALSILNHLSITSVIIVGWSLGGHIGIELVPLLNPAKAPKSHHRAKGLMLTGTPPVPRGQLGVGFRPPAGNEEGINLAGTASMTPAQLLAFAQAGVGVQFGGAFPPWILEAATRTDGRARADMFAAFVAGEGVDQRQVVESDPSGCLVGVVNGAEEPYVELDYLDGIKFANLWQGKCIRLDRLGHTPFWEKFEVYEAVLREFVDECAYL